MTDFPQEPPPEEPPAAPTEGEAEESPAEEPPAEEPVVEPTAEERKAALLAEISEITAAHEGESNIPVGHKYWDLLNEYRTL